ncbi:MAG: hypothetical protein Q3X33_01530 [Gemmiger sp.]|nr:hypothetical protein [Gemmiger sp.]
MQITANAWNEYITRLSRLNQKAGQLMRQYIDTHGTGDADALITYAAALVTKYGEGSAELACQMYDALAEAANAGVPAAEPAEPADYGEVARMVNATKNQNPANLPNGVSRLVKRAGADTTLKNAVRDGAEWAWVPHGDTCPFCITLASNGWQKASSKVLKGGHAEHIHANCDCEFAIRFDHNTTLAGYDPEKYLKQYRDAGGDINKMRRVNYAANRERINAQKRASYAARMDYTSTPKRAIIDYSKAVFSGKKDITWHLNKHKANFEGWTEEQYLRRARELLMEPLQLGELEEVTRSDGSVSRYCYRTNEFIATTSDGNIRTFFKPERGKEYWKDEHDRN